MNWISPVELAIIHERVIAETGGIQGIINTGGLESALARPFSSFGGVELFPDLKIPRWAMSAAPVITAGGEIAGVDPLKISHRFKITEKTTKLLHLRLLRS